jgi:mycoredoxin
MSAAQSGRLRPGSETAEPLSGRISAATRLTLLMNSAESESIAQPDAGRTITVYWRPGCGFCSSLFRQLDRYGLPYQRVNIWEDASGAEFVRSVARGNETVPTVAVGSTAMVNPSVDQIAALLV